MKKLCFTFLFILSCSLHATTHPRLIVQIVVDQLRGDLIERYHEKMGHDGFNYLLQHGVQYTNAHHPHANTVTCVGHTTIATGSYPSLHGIISNDWYDRTTGQLVYCMDDPKAKIIPTIRTKETVEGRSPHQILTSTTSDEIVLAQKGRAFGISYKDRSAISLAGHAGIAYWFDRKNGGFISSDYYLKQYPQWVDHWNQQYQDPNPIWSLSYPNARYTYKNAPTFKNRFPHFGLSFPHRLSAKGAPDFYKLLLMTPMADEITGDFAAHLIKAEHLGKNPEQTDYLGISFSAVDAIGHQFGPNSLESEDNLLRLDKTLALLIKTIKEEVGLENTLIVLTADHGVSDSLAYLAAHHMPIAPVLDLKKLNTTMIHFVKKRFALPAETVKTIEFPYVYLNHRLINEKGLTVEFVAKSLAHYLSRKHDVFRVLALTELTQDHGWLENKVAKMAYMKRAGDLYIVPFSQQNIDEVEQHHVEHGTPWSYDSYVPLIFSQAQFKAQQVVRPVSTTDIAATLAIILNIKQPSACTGKPLIEVIK